MSNITKCSLKTNSSFYNWLDFHNQSLAIAQMHVFTVYSFYIYGCTLKLYKNYINNTKL